MKMTNYSIIYFRATAQFSEWDLRDGISTVLSLWNESLGSKSWAYIYKTKVGCHLDLRLITVQPSGSSRELLGQCLPHPQYYEAGTPFFAGLPDSVVATVRDDKAISSSVWTVSGLWQIAGCALQPHPSPILLLPNGGGIYGFWFICCLLLCLGLNLRLGLTIWLSSEEERVAFQLCAKDSRIPTRSLLFIHYSASDLRRVAAHPEWSRRRQTIHSHHGCTLRSKSQDGSVKSWLSLLCPGGEAST